MSESKPSALSLGALVSKKTRRAKARLLQNFAKTDKTTDELFECYEINFNKQQSISLNLQKRIKHYVHCFKELHQAGKELSTCILELHEKDWPKHDIIENNDYELEQINDDFEEKLVESVLMPLDQYIGQFAEVREKIAKRGRKLVDYDSERRIYEAMAANQATKPVDDVKLNKHREQLIEARKVYESLNNELHEELPALYENRIPLVITIMQRLYSSKVAYYSENVALCRSYLDCVDTLARVTDDKSIEDFSTFAAIPKISPVSNKQKSVNTTPSSQHHTTTTTDQQHHSAASASTTTITTTTQDNNRNCQSTDDGQNNKKQQSNEELSDKVIVTYKYMAEDEDELDLDAGDIIQVVEYDDPSEKEEGWLVGVKESGEKGLFPANFTRPLSVDEALAMQTLKINREDSKQETINNEAKKE